MLCKVLQDLTILEFMKSEADGSDSVGEFPEGQVNRENLGYHLGCQKE